MHRYRSYAPTRRRGYTLIELLIVIALLGIAGAILVPHLVDQDSMTGQAAVRKLIGDLSFAQSDALAHQEFRRVHFFADGSGYCIIRVDSSNVGDAWATFDPADIDYIRDPLASGGDSRYITDFTADRRFAQVRIASMDIDDGVNDAEGDIIYDALGGTVLPDGNNPGTGGDIVLQAGTDAFTIGVSPFTGKLTVD